MDREDFEIKFADLCKTANETMFKILMRGLINMRAGENELNRLEKSYLERFGHQISRKELTSSANEVSQ